MKHLPKYNEKIIVLVRYKASYQWYVTDKEIWFLDLRKLIASFSNKGYMVSDPNDFSDRFDIDVVSEHNAENFLTSIQEAKASNDELREMMQDKIYSHITDMSPVLYVDFDDRKLSSYYPEPASYEDFVPAGWKGIYKDFSKEIPQNYKYWIIQDMDYLTHE